MNENKLPLWSYFYWTLEASTMSIALILMYEWNLPLKLSGGIFYHTPIQALIDNVFLPNIYILGWYSILYIWFGIIFRLHIDD